jgi:hypothetical protein
MAEGVWYDHAWCEEYSLTGASGEPLNLIWKDPPSTIFMARDLTCSGDAVP